MLSAGGWLVGSTPAAAIVTGIQRTVTSPGGAVSGAEVDIRPAGASASSTATYTGSTDSSGHYAVTTAAGSWDLYIVPPSGSGLNTFTDPGVTVTDGTVTTVDAALVSSAVATVVFNVVSGGGVSVGSHVYFQLSGGGSNVSGYTNSSGQFTANVVPGTYNLNIDGYDYGTGTIPYFDEDGNATIRAAGVIDPTGQ